MHALTQTALRRMGQARVPHSSSNGSHASRVHLLVLFYVFSSGVANPTGIKALLHTKTAYIHPKARVAGSRRAMFQAHLHGEAGSMLSGAANPFTIVLKMAEKP